MDEYKVYSNPELKFTYHVFPNGYVYRVEKWLKIKPYKDPRRPNEPPQFFFKRKDGKGREFWYCHEFMATMFFENYNSETMCIHFKDKNVENFSVDNLYICTALDALKNIYHETARWKKVFLTDTNLFYDYYICEDGRLYNGSTDSFVEPFQDTRERNKGYLRYNLYYGKSSREVIHVGVSRLVALHFLPVHPPGNDIVIHRDNNVTNNHYTNLSWVDDYGRRVKNIIENEEKDCRTDDTEILGDEVWKKLKIPNVELRYNYSISNYGRVYNEDYKVMVPYFTGSPNLNNQSHLSVSLVTDKGGKRFFVHRLVAYVFVKNKNPEKYMFINHINGNPECNWYLNLEWCTSFENLDHAIKTNLSHSKIFEGHVTDKYWRLNTILAWIYSKQNITDEKAYSLYNKYKENYSDNIPDLTYDEFITEYTTRLNENSDFIKVMNFYKFE